MNFKLLSCFQEIYEQIDKNNDGTIEFEEFVTVLDHPKVNLSRYILSHTYCECNANLLNCPEEMCGAQLRSHCSEYHQVERIRPNLLSQTTGSKVACG